MALASSDRFSPLLRWIGITLVVLTLLQMLAVLALWDWQAEPFRQLVVERLIKESPMALVGLLLMYLSGRLDDQNGWRRSPLLWTVCILSGLMAVLLTASLPIVFGGDQLMQEETDQQLAAKKGQLEMAREQSKNPQVLKQLLRQAEAAGQVPPGASEAQKIQSARAFVDRQLQQMEGQFKQAEQTSRLAINQRRFGSTFGAIALIVAFTLLCLGSVL
ncbi:MAG: HpsJ family protein [Cyanobium sp.]